MSERDIKILEQISHGKPIKAIAEEIGIAHKSLERRLYLLRKKHRAVSTPHLLSMAFREGLLK